MRGGGIICRFEILFTLKERKKKTTYPTARRGVISTANRVNPFLAGKPIPMIDMEEKRLEETQAKPDKRDKQKINPWQQLIYLAVQVLIILLIRACCN